MTIEVSPTCERRMVLYLGSLTYMTSVRGKSRSLHCYAADQLYLCMKGKNHRHTLCIYLFQLLVRKSTSPNINPRQHNYSLEKEEFHKLMTDASCFKSSSDQLQGIRDQNLHESMGRICMCNMSGNNIHNIIATGMLIMISLCECAARVLTEQECNTCQSKKRISRTYQ